MKSKPDPRRASRRSSDRELLEVLDASWNDARARAGDRLVCRPGCTPCCVGPFPITSLDADRLAAGLRRLAVHDPPAAREIVARAERDAAAFAGDFPGDAVSGTLGADDGAVEDFLDRHGNRRCAALDDAAGTCRLYDHRPVSCRTFGPPTRIGGQDLPPCDLCFVGAGAAEIERCRVEPDPGGLEPTLLPDERETLIAFALAGRFRSRS